MTTLMLNYKKKKSFINSKSNFHSCDSSSHQLLRGDFFTVSRQLLGAVCFSLHLNYQEMELYLRETVKPKSLGNPCLNLGTLCGLSSLGNLSRNVLKGHPKRNKTSVYTKFKLRGWNRRILPLSLLFLSLDLM